MRSADRFVPGLPADDVREFIAERNAQPELQVVESSERRPLRRERQFRRYKVPNDPRRVLPPAPKPRGPACACLTAEEHLSGCSRVGHA